MSSGQLGFVGPWTVVGVLLWTAVLAWGFARVFGSGLSSLGKVALTCIIASVGYVFRGCNQLPAVIASRSLPGGPTASLISLPAWWAPLGGLLLAMGIHFMRRRRRSSQPGGR